MRDYQISADQAREALSYDAETGVFRWRVKVGRGVAVAYPGDVAGNKGATVNGYLYISLNRQRLLAHRMAWLYVHGEWPTRQIDHINGDRRDNRMCNLRLATASENACNGRLRATNTSGLRGVSWSKDKRKWVARIVKDRKQHVLGYFGDKQQAHLAYLEAAGNLHGAFSQSDLRKGQ